VRNVARARLPSGDLTVPASVGSGVKGRARLPSGDFFVPASVGSGVRGVVDSNTKQEKKEQVKAAAEVNTKQEKKEQVKAAVEVPRFPRWGQHALDGCGGWATIKANGPLREVDLATFRQQGKALPRQKCGEERPGPKLSARFGAFAEEGASSDDSDKGDDDDNVYSEGCNGHYGEGGCPESYFIGDGEAAEQPVQSMEVGAVLAAIAAADRIIQEADVAGVELHEESLLATRVLRASLQRGLSRLIAQEEQF